MPHHAHHALSVCCMVAWTQVVAHAENMPIGSNRRASIQRFCDFCDFSLTPLQLFLLAIFNMWTSAAALAGPSRIRMASSFTPSNRPRPATKPRQSNINSLTPTAAAPTPTSASAATAQSSPPRGGGKSLLASYKCTRCITPVIHQEFPADHFSSITKYPDSLWPRTRRRGRCGVVLGQLDTACSGR
jgi:hypothetical protein